MNPRSRIAFPLVGCLLGTAWLVLALATSPEILPSEERARPRSELSPPPPAASSWEPGTVRAVPLESAPPPELRLPDATAALDAPWPEPEDGESPPQVNEPIEPEQPQTAAWRHGKLVRITELLDRDVERLERERERAQARGDGAEARRLAVQLSRHRARLGSLRAETTVLAEEAREE
ncbi:hypothetical protein [Melittangium boletus]|uniref:Uncharacterized protein n=1 Tax=Melittangium boletus DSM 14713 TaxID=1294270 RepID=A0A250IDQ0_9BACT|nr:hypothetical protein [Melittangium boletus]ATB29363.1 hypothetical protein MEBOL_002812 [Melittangium boletus DSM 14713]